MPILARARRDAHRSVALRLAVGLGFAAVFGCPSVAGAFTAAASSSAPTVSYWGPQDARNTTQILHRLTITSGDQPEDLIVGTSGSFSLAGPGTLQLVGGTSSISVTAPDRSRRDACNPDPQSAVGSAARLTLPPLTTTTLQLVQTLRLRRAPTDPAAFTSTWSVSAWPPAPAPAAQFTDRAPRLIGVRPSSLTLTAAASGAHHLRSRAPASPSLTVLLGRPVTLRGRLSPTGAGGRVVLWSYAPGASTPTPFRSVPVAADGRFTLRDWVPPAAGDYELFARYAGIAGRIEGSRSPCAGPLVRVTDPR